MNRLRNIVLALVLPTAGVAQTAPSAEAPEIAPAAPGAAPAAPAEAFPEPDRPVAEIVTDRWWNEERRDEAGEAERVRALMGFEPGDVVADIGAGSGYHTVRLAPALEPGGRVVAQDVVPDYLEGLRGRLEAEGIANVELVLGDVHDPRLAPDTLDGAILVHMYHEIAQPYGLLYNLVPALREGARVGVVDLDRSTARHGTPLGLLECEFGQVGYALLETHDLGAVGYLAVFEPPAADARPAPEAMAACQG